MRSKKEFNKKRYVNRILSCCIAIIVILSVFAFVTGPYTALPGVDEFEGNGSLGGNDAVLNTSTANLKYDSSTPLQIQVNGSLGWSGVYYLYYPVYSGKSVIAGGTGSYNLTWRRYEGTGIGAVPHINATSGDFVFGGDGMDRNVYLNHSGIWLIDNDDIHDMSTFAQRDATVPAWFWVNTSAGAFNVTVSESVFSYGDNGSFNVTVDVGSTGISEALVAIYNESGRLVGTWNYNQWTSGLVSSNHLSKNSSVFTNPGNWFVDVYYDADSDGGSDQISYYEGFGAGYNYYHKLFYGEASAINNSATLYSFNTCGPWDPPEYNASTEIITVNVSAPPGDENGTGTVTGIVSDQFDSPLPGATVMLNRTDQPQIPQFVLSNDTGVYIFDDNVTTGTYDLTFFKEGYESHTINDLGVFTNETRWENMTLGQGGGGDPSPIEIDQWGSSVNRTYILVNTTQSFNFSIRMFGGSSRLSNLTIDLPTGFSYAGNNGTSISDTNNFTVINTADSITWIKMNDQGFSFSDSGYTYFWFDSFSNATLGSQFFNITAVDSSNNSSTCSLTVFTTTTFFAYGTVKDNENNQPIVGAVANITAQSFSQTGSAFLGYFTAETNSTGVYNITNIPTTTNVSTLQMHGHMGSGGGEGQIFYQLSIQNNSGTYTTLATDVSPSLPDIPITEFIRMLQGPEIYLKPALSFRVNVTGPIFSWNDTTHEMEVTYGAKQFSLMVKDQRLGYQVKQYNSMGGERTFSVDAGRNYSFTVFADQSFPISVRFNDILSTCQSTGDFNLTGVNTTVMAYNGTYLINVSIDVNSTNQYLTGYFNNVTNPTEMKVVVYTMEDQDMVFEDWPMPFNIGNDRGDGCDDQYDLDNNSYNITLPATIASSYMLLRAYAKNSTGYYMGSKTITAEGQTLSSSTVNFSMEKLISGTSRVISSQNVSNQWTDESIVNTTSVLFNLVNETGALLSTESPHIEIKREIDGTDYGTFAQGSSGQFNMSIVEGGSIKKLTIYSQQYAPISTSVSAAILNGSANTTTIRCNNGTCNITLRSFGDFDPLGKQADIKMQMMKSNSTCNVPNPPAICDLCAGDDGEGEDGEIEKDNFSPFKAILKGDISMMIKSNTSSGWIYVYYINVDLLASGPPDAAFSTESEEAESGLAVAWQFGSQGPEIYDYVLIGIPMDQNNTNKTVKVEIPKLYNNDFVTIWNSSAGDTVDTIRNDSTLNSLYGDYLCPAYEAYFNGTGVICNASDPTLSFGLGYKDVVNETIWIKIPHFSAIGPQIEGQEPDPPTNFAKTINSSTEVYLTWTKPLKADYTYIERNTTGQTSWDRGSGEEIYNGTGTAYSDTGLAENVTYYYQAWSWNETNNYWSVTYSSNHSTYYPGEPTSFTATAASSTSISLTWTKGNLSDYTRIQRSTSTYPSNISDGTNVVNTTATSATDTGLTASTPYYYTAWAYNSTDNEWSITNSTTTATTSSSTTSNNPVIVLPPAEEEQDEEDSENTTGTTTSSNTVNEVNTRYGLNLSEEFYANDTDGDGIVDTFTDPNGNLTAVTFVDINNSRTFLISTDEDEIPEFFWDTTTDTITEITHSPGTVSDSIINFENETLTVTVTIDKANWVYIEITDDYPEYALTVKTSDGRTIDSSNIWRKNDKIYVLDDPDTEYNFVYNYSILAPTFNPESNSQITTAKPTITITYNEKVTVQNATWNNNEIDLKTSDNIVFTYTQESNLTDGIYILILQVNDTDNNTRTDTANYEVKLQTSSSGGNEPTDQNPLLILIIAVIAIIVIIILILFKSGFLYLEKDSEKKHKKQKIQTKKENK